MRRTEIERLLPEVFQRALRPETPLLAVLDVMEVLHAPCEEVLAHLEQTFSAYRSPDRFLPFLARWVDLERFFPPPPGGTPLAEWSSQPLSTGMGRLRELIAAAAQLSQWRGTAYGLTRFLEVATGMEGFRLDEQVPGPDGTPRPFHLRVHAPAEAAEHRTLIERIIGQEKPAYVTFELAFESPTQGGE